MKLAIVCGILLLMLLPTRVTQAKVPLTPQTTDADCLRWASNGNAHHIPAPWLFTGGTQRAWKFGTTRIVAVLVAACGGQWLFAKYNAGVFTTNFFPSRGYAYILEQVRRYHASPAAKTAVSAAARGASRVRVLPVILLPNIDTICRYIPAMRQGLPSCNQN